MWGWNCSCSLHENDHVALWKCRKRLRIRNKELRMSRSSQHFIFGVRMWPDFLEAEFRIGIVSRNKMHSDTSWPNWYIWTSWRKTSGRDIGKMSRHAVAAGTRWLLLLRFQSNAIVDVNQRSRNGKSVWCMLSVSGHTFYNCSSYVYYVTTAQHLWPQCLCS